MKANPGGQIATKAVIGRDSLIDLIWETIEQQSIVMTAERRIGKTTIIRKMLAEPVDGWTPVFQDLERCHTAHEFAMVVYHEVHRFLSAKGKAARRAREWFAAMGGTEIGGLFKLPEKSAGAHWKDILCHSIEDLVHENDQTGTRLLFLWDEVPFMLSNIRDREGEAVAMEVLDVLRALRQTHSGLRMIITGSIGLHHVITSLKDKSYANSPVNDMVSINVPALALQDAIQLAKELIEGEKLNSPGIDVAAAVLANEADCFPFYIHHIVKALKIRGMEATLDQIRRVVASQLVDDNDPWELFHYRSRIPTYYGQDESAVIRILDELSVSEKNASVNELLIMLKNTSSFDDRERLIRLLSLMVRDHYLSRDPDGSYRFAFPLIRRWWKAHRDL
jgi:hypothetical protein